MKIIKLEQRSDEWLEFRKSHIGASEIASIMGVDPWRTPYQLWCEKTGLVESQPPNKAMERGIFMEDEALHRFIAIKERFYEPMVGVYNRWDVASASFDGVSEDHKYMVEIKIPGERVYLEMKDVGIPKNYYYQCQWQMMINEKCKESEIFVYQTEHSNFSCLVFPDSLLHEKLLVEAKKFWECVLTNTPPALQPNECEFIFDPQFDSLVKHFDKLDVDLKHLKIIHESAKEDLKKYANGRSIKGFGVTVTSNLMTKSIDYKQLCSDLGIGEEIIEKYVKYSEPYAKITKYKV